MYYFVISVNDDDNDDNNDNNDKIPKYYVDVDLTDYYVKTKQKEINNYLKEILKEMYNNEYVVSDICPEKEFEEYYQNIDLIKIDYNLLKKLYRQYSVLLGKYTKSANDLKKFKKKISL